MLDQVKEEQGVLQKAPLEWAFALLLTVCHAKAAKHLLVEVEDEDQGLEEEVMDPDAVDDEYNPDMDKPRRQQNKRLGFLHAQFGKRG